MKNLFKISLILLLFLALGTQKTFSQVMFGVKGGANFATIAQSMADKDDEYSAKMRILYSIGGVVDFSLSDAISLQSGLSLSAKGFSVDVDKDYDATGYDRYTVNYLEIPLNVVFKIQAFRVYAGPYVAFGIFGKNKWDLKGNDDDWEESGDTKMKFVMKEVDAEDYMNDDVLYLKRMDMGLNFGLGYKLGPVIVNAGYSLGLANLTPDITDVDYNPDDYKTSTRTITLTATYFFGK